KSRDDLITAGVGQMFKEGQVRLARAVEGRGPRDGLIAYVDFYLSAAHRDTSQAGCPLPFLSADATRLPDEARAQYARGVAGLTAAIAQRLAALDIADPEGQASSMLAEMVGAVALARAEPDPERSDLILTRSRQAVKRRLGLEAS
ncbi:MAG: TetR family transcriptional regulator, partial [Caulobacter sp.]|nr:TetR family transcriptional regulator [Caulobacter sp.]